MTRKSPREIENALDDLAGDDDRDLGRPLTEQEKAALGPDAGEWNRTRRRREMARALLKAAREAN